MYPVLGILTPLPPQESLNYLGRRAETGHKCRNFKIIIRSVIPHQRPAMLKPTPIASNPVHRGRVIEVSTEVLRYANGRDHELDFVRHPGAAAVVAVDETDRVCFVRQYRHGIADFLWEIPAGKLDSGEAPAVCAVRELAEETGVTARNWTAMGVYLPAPGIFTEVIHLYLARDLDIGVAAPDVDEELELEWLPLNEAIARVQRGDWNDGKTAMALMRAQYHLQL
jgi:8-oxo-dGTP pyrophosphatase MutT (NUDIX family)